MSKRTGSVNDFETKVVVLIIMGSLVSWLIGWAFWRNFGDSASRLFFEWKLLLWQIITFFQSSPALEAIDKYRQTVPKEEWQQAHIWTMSQWVGHYTRYFFGSLFFLGAGFFAYKGAEKEGLLPWKEQEAGERKLTLQKLADIQSKEFPHLLPVLRPGETPVDEDNNVTHKANSLYSLPLLGWFFRILSGRKFSKAQDGEVLEVKRSRWGRAKKPIDIVKAIGCMPDKKTFDRKKAEDYFASQLTQVIHKKANLTIPQVVIASICLLRINLKTDDAVALQDEANVMWARYGCIIKAYKSAEYPNFRNAIKFVLKEYGASRPSTQHEDGEETRPTLIDLLQDYEEGNHISLESFLPYHGYNETLLLRLVKEARARAGVFPTQYFIWLKADERNLWYALNSLGGQTQKPEGAGSVCHFMAECTYGKAIKTPIVGKAVDGLIRLLKEERVLDASVEVADD